MMTREKPAGNVPEIDLDRVIWDADYRKWALKALKTVAPKRSKREADSGGSADG